MAEASKIYMPCFHPYAHRQRRMPFSGFLMALRSEQVPPRANPSNCVAWATHITSNLPCSLTLKRTPEPAVAVTSSMSGSSQRQQGRLHGRHTTRRLQLRLCSARGEGRTDVGRPVPLLDLPQGDWLGVHGVRGLGPEPGHGDVYRRAMVNGSARNRGCYPAHVRVLGYSR